MPLEEKTVVGGLSARRYNPGKVAPGGFHSCTRVSLVTSLPFAIAQHPHPRESERRLLPLPPLPAGRAGWGIRGDRPMKPAFLRPGSGQRQGGRARTQTHSNTHTLTHSHTGARALAFTLAHAHPAQHGEGETRRGLVLLTIGFDAHRTTGRKESGLASPFDHVSFKFSSNPNPRNSRAGDILVGRREPGKG